MGRNTLTPPDSFWEELEHPTPSVDPEQLWDTRPYLAMLRRYALARYTSPWAVLGMCLTRVVAATEPNIKLPATIGTEASLNLFLALVGASGSGKDAAAGVATRAIEIHTPDGNPLQIDQIPIGSGEGLTDVYMRIPQRRPRRPQQQDGIGEDLLGLDIAGNGAYQYRTRALITIPEIDTLGSLMERRGSTIGGQLRQAAMGQQLGFFYRDESKRLIVPAHTYRMCLALGVQPRRAATLLAEADGGTPQRFIWLPATDPAIQANPTPEPAGLYWEAPRYAAPQVLYNLCQTAHDTILGAHLDRNRGTGNPLDGHRLLAQLKASAAFSLLDGPTLEITEQDWWLAGLLMAKSDATRDQVVQQLADATREEAQAKNLAAASQAVAVQEGLESATLDKTIRWVSRRLSVCPAGEWLMLRDLRHAVKSAWRPCLAEALDVLVSRGFADREDMSASGNPTVRYRRSL